VSEAKITRADLEQRFRLVQEDLTNAAEDARTKVLAVGAGALVLLVLIAYLMGRRGGKKKSTIVEIRRL
jgi:hypothetical protein